MPTVGDARRRSECHQHGRGVDHPSGIRGDHGTEDGEGGVHKVVAHAVGRHGGDVDGVGVGDFIERPVGVEPAGKLVVDLVAGLRVEA